VKALAMNARWQVRRMRGRAPRTILFIDEPSLSTFGSAYVNLTRERAVTAIDEVVSAAREEGALVGIHCCGNTDWSLLAETGADIINFDAHAFFEGFALYPRELSAFLARGGSVAFGVVPSAQAAARETADSLAALLQGELERLEESGVDRGLLERRMLITPSCGLSSLSVELAEGVLALAREVSSRFRPR
jgi:methionine synthase II (cobalamin-independent)